MSRVLYDGPYRIREITAYVRRIRDSGTRGECPVCGACVHVAKRRLRISLVRALVRMRDLNRGVVAAAMKIAANGQSANDWYCLQYWGLISHEGREWGLTIDGHRFLAGEIAVPEHVFIEHDRVVDISPETVTIHDVIRADERFSIDDFLRPWAPERAPPSAQRELALGAV